MFFFNQLFILGQVLQKLNKELIISLSYRSQDLPVAMLNNYVKALEEITYCSRS